MRLSIAVLALIGACPACSRARRATNPESGAMQAALAVERQRPPLRSGEPRDSAPDRQDPRDVPAACAPHPDAPAWLDCGGTRIRSRTPLVVHPTARLPDPATRAVLDAVAALISEHPTIRLLRIEAYSSHDPAGAPAAIRREIERSQDRADAVFRYLWRARGVSPERLEAVGRGWLPGHAVKDVRFPVELRVVQQSDASRR